MPPDFHRRTHYPIHRPPPADPRDIVFQKGDHVVVRVLDVPHRPTLDWLHRQCIVKVPWLNRWLSHHTVEIYSRASQCMYTMGIGRHFPRGSKSRRRRAGGGRNGTQRQRVFVQTPDRKWLVSRKYACTHVPVLPIETAHTRLKRLHELGLVVHHARLTSTHVAWLQQFISRLRRHSKRAWRHTSKQYGFGLLAKVWHALGIRVPRTHNCQTFAEQFVHQPEQLFADEHSTTA